MSTDKKNECPVAAGQVAKSIKSRASNFIAAAARYATADAGCGVMCVVVLVQALFLALAGVLQ